jgi:lactoylglutathione lyase
MIALRFRQITRPGDWLGRKKRHICDVQPILLLGAAMQPIQLGNFSVSLAVKDIEASRQFYEKLGFAVFMGESSQGWLILKSGDAVIGLFQGMFEKNTLTFNPGWDNNAQPLDQFTDVRELQRRLKAEGVALAMEADESTTGPERFMAIDPDGNPILVDQHR